MFLSIYTSLELTKCFPFIFRHVDFSFQMLNIFPQPSCHCWDSKSMTVTDTLYVNELPDLFQLSILTFGGKILGTLEL